ncbi:hypothetical protein ACFSTC_43930 [Nonomuraea ferruginea]
MLTAKAAVVGVIGLVTGPVVVFGTHLVCRWVIGDRFSGLYQAPFAGKLPLLVALSLTVPVFALLGLGLGAILRSTAGGITLLVGLVYVIPMIVGNLPGPWNEWLGSVMISALARQISGDLTTPGLYGTSLPPADGSRSPGLLRGAPRARGPVAAATERRLTTQRRHMPAVGRPQPGPLAGSVAIV